MAIYEKIFDLFKLRINDDCEKDTTRKLLSPILMFMDLYEKERTADLIHEIFQQACIEFQWYYWTSDEYYGGVGEWREFPPVCVSQLNKAVRDKKTSVQILLAQRNYVVDFNEMTKRLIQDNVVSTHYGQYSAPVFAKAKLMDEFNIEEFRQHLNELAEKRERHCVIVRGILKLLHSSIVTPLESELVFSALTLLLRLITNKNMAADFIENDGIHILMQLRCLQAVDGKISPTLVNSIIFLILRKCIDFDDIALKNAFDQIIVNTCNGFPISLLEEKSRRHGLRAKRYKTDPKRVFRLIAPMAAIYPSIFIEQMKNKLEIKKDELKIKDKVDLKHDSDSSLDTTSLKKVLQATIDQLQYSINKGVFKENSVFHTSNLLKFFAEIVRSYPQASYIFVNMILDGQNVVSWLIDKFLLNYSKEDKDSQEVVLSTKALLSSLIGDHSTSNVVDRVVEDVKNLLFANIEKYNKAIFQVISLSDKTKLATKFADQLIVITQLLILLRDAAGQGNTLTPGDSTKQMILLVKSMSKNNLFNILVKSIWILPFHEPQGFEAVNTLLKLFESIVGKDMNRFTFSRNNTIREEPRQHITNRTTGIEQQHHDPNHPSMDIDVGGNANLDESEHQPEERNERNADLDSIFTISTAHRMMPEVEADEHEGNHPNLVDDNEHEEESSTQSDEEDDMDTAEEMDATQADATAEEAAEEDMEDDDERNSENIVGGEGTAERVNNQNFGVDAPDGIDDDDEEDEDEEWDDEGSNNDETLVEFEDAMADYLDMVDFSDISNELNSMRQSIHRLNVEFSNAFASQQFQQVERTYQAFMQQIPRHFRALISHPRGGGAVLRIRNQGAQNLTRGNQNITSPIRIGITRGIGGEQIFGQFINQMAGWPPTAINGGGDSSSNRQTAIMTPHFVDRLLDQCRILDPHSMFLIGVLIASYVATAIYIQDTPEEKIVAQSGKADDLSSEKQPATVPEHDDHHVAGIENQPMQQIEESSLREGNEEQMAAQNIEPILGEEHQNIELPPPVVQEAEQIEPPQQETGTSGENVASEGVPEGVDPAFLAALPEEMRQEVIRDHLIQQQMNAATNTQVTTENDLPPERLAAIIGMEVPEGMDPAFLAALPEDIFQEVVRDHQRQQELARQRRAQVDNQNNLRPRIRHHHHHHRHFAMPHLFQSHGLMRSSTSNSHQNPQIAAMTQPTGSALQLFDSQSICTLLLLYLLDQDKFNIVRLQKLLRSICLHPGSCDFTIWALLSMLDGLQNFSLIECVQSEKSNIGWINNLRSGALDKNERLIRITPLSVQINQQLRTQASHHVVDTLGHLAQRFANHFMPKSARGGESDVNRLEHPPNISIFWNILRSINTSNPEQMLKIGAKPENLSELAAETLESSPFAFIVKFVHSQLPIADKIIRTTSLLSRELQKLPGNFCEKVPEETRKWIGQEMNALTNILLERPTNEALRDGRALIAQLLSVFPDEKASIMETLHDCILKSGDQLREQLSILQKHMNEVK